METVLKEKFHNLEKGNFFQKGKKVKNLDETLVRKKNSPNLWDGQNLKENVISENQKAIARKTIDFMPTNICGAILVF